MTQMSETADLDYGKLKEAQFIKLDSLERELYFTRVYQENEHEHPYIREVLCLRAQFPAMLADIEEGDWFAGRLNRMLVGVDPERGDLTEVGYYCKYDFLQQKLSDPTTDEPTRKNIRTLIDFWKQHDTARKCRQAFPPEVQKGIPSDDYYRGEHIAFPMYGLGGPCLDYRKLVKIGIDGLRREVKQSQERKKRIDKDEAAFYHSLEMVLDLFTSVARWYAKKARKQAVASTAHRVRLKQIAESLEHIAHAPPQTYHQAVQLVWLYSLLSLAKNYGRLDVVLGDFLANDLERGVISEQEVLDMTVSLWRLIVARGDNFNNRIIIGGKGRPNPENADRFALLALKVQGLVREAIPQLSLRWHQGMNPAIWQAAFDTLARGSTFPIFYNDDVNVPAAARAFDVPLEEAEQCIMYGCGEYVIDHRSVGSPDAAINVLKALNVTLHNGVDPFTGRPSGLALGEFKDFKRFEDLQNAFARQVKYHIKLLAKVQETNYSVTGKICAFPFLSLLYDDCIARGKPLLNGGVKYLGGTVESFGNNSAADSLLAIKKIVYEQKRLTPEQLLACLRDDFIGHEKERALLQGVAKFGNDDPEADAMSLWVNALVANACREQTRHTALDSFMMVMINNGDSVTLGRATAASADGRRCGEPLSNGNQPSAGMDRNGLTALLNSMAKLDPGIHAGAVHNLKINRRLLLNERQKVQALIRGYFASGGTQFMLTITDRAELEDALEHPEKYANLIVRVGGYSERFVDLPRDVQLEIIRRTLY